MLVVQLLPLNNIVGRS